MKKQLSGSDKTSSKAMQKQPVQKVLEQETASKKALGDRQSQLQAKAANKANDSTNRSHVQKVSVETQPSSSNARATVYAERNVAQSPALVSINNEPIPHKRRRRQPTLIENTGAVAKVSSTKKAVVIDANSNEKAAVWLRQNFI